MTCCPPANSWQRQTSKAAKKGETILANQDMTIHSRKWIISSFHPKKKHSLISPFKEIGFLILPPKRKVSW